MRGGLALHEDLPPAYDRDRVGPDRGARQGGADGGRSAGGGLYGGPLYDREPYGYRYSGAGADGVRPDRSEMERAGRAEFERGYRTGREDERYRLRAEAAHPAAMRGTGSGPARASAGGRADDDWDVVVLLVERDHRQQQAMQDLRRSLQEARTAIQQDDRARAEAALAQADQKLRMAGPGVGGDRLAAALVNQAELALERGDQEAARRALRQARQAAGDPGGGQQQAQQQQRSPDSGGSGSDGGGGQQQGAAGGGSRQQTR